MPRRVLMIGATLLLAVLGTVAVLLYVGKADARALAGKQAVTVLVAAKKVPAGTSAHDADRDGLLRKEEMAAETVPADALAEVGSDVTDLVASADIQPGQLVLRPMFVTRALQTGGLKIPDGKVAVSVSVSGAQRVAGYAEVGSKVAVFDTFNVAEGHGGRTPAGDGLQKQHDYVQGTRLVLSGVEVIAVGPQGSGSAGDAKKSSATAGGASGGSDTVLVTVAVTQAEAEKLILVAQAGSVYLALESGTSKTAPSDGVDNHVLFAN
jgi:Flp pilus assembly protein CpaB